jgi:hypothetical protein
MDVSEAARRVLTGDTNDPEVWHALQANSDDNGQKYYLLLSAVGHADFLKHVPAMLTRVIKTRAWERWRWIGSEFTAPSLGIYLTKSPPKGLGASLEMVEKLISNDVEALALFRRETTAPPGRTLAEPEPMLFEPKRPGPAPTLFDQPKTQQITNSDNVTNSNPRRGNSKAYTLSRLESEAPELFKLVVQKKLSANAAAIKAGFRKPPPTILQLFDRLLKRATPEDRAAMRVKLSQ